MSRSSQIVDQRAVDFMREFASSRESPAAAELRAVTATHPRHNMQIGLEQGRLMAHLVEMTGARHCLEVGVFTGYSALCVAERLPADGRLVAIDISDEWTAIGKPYWEKAGVADLIELRLGPASEVLGTMVDEGAEGSFDFIFIDANKDGYDDYFEKCLRLARRGGVLVFDNIFLRGRTYDPAHTGEAARVVRALVSEISTDERVNASIIPICDGVLIASKK